MFNLVTTLTLADLLWMFDPFEYGKRDDGSNISDTFSMSNEVLNVMAKPQSSAIALFSFAPDSL